MLPLLLLLAQASSPDPRALLERAIQAVAAQRPERSRYFGKEEIQTFRIGAGQRKRISWHTYEAMVLGDQVRYKRTRNNGKPIAARRQELQPEGKRWEMRYDRLLAHHDLTLAGEETVDGRPAWVVRTALRSDAPPPLSLADLGLLGSLTLWLDKESGMDILTRLETTRPFRGLERGTLIETRLTKVDNVFVASRVLIRIPGARSTVETVQTYSDYRRFSSDVVIRFEPDVP